MNDLCNLHKIQILHLAENILRGVRIMDNHEELQVSFLENEDSHREVFMLELIRLLTQHFPQKMDESKDISDLFDSCAKDLFKKYAGNNNGYVLADISSFFDKSFDMMNAFEIIKRELEFYDEADYETIRSLFCELQQCINSFPKFESFDTDQKKFFPNKKDLERYLNVYYQIVDFLFKNGELLFEDNFVDVNDNKDHIESMCEVLTYAPAKKDCSIYSFYCAEALLTLYETLPKLYSDEDAFSSDKSDQIIKRMIDSAFSIKIFRKFRHFVVRDDNQALLSCENTDNFLEKRNYKLSSYELIRPVRLFSKIKSFSKKSFDKFNEIGITIVGAVYIDLNYVKTFLGNEIALESYSHEMYQLCTLLKEDDVTCKKKYKIDIYLNKNAFSSFKNPWLKETVTCISDNITVDFKFYDYKRLSYKNFIQEMVVDNQLLFILDCPFIYENTKVRLESESLSDFYKKLPSNYSDDVSLIAESTPIQKIQTQLNVAMLGKQNKTGTFERRLKEPILKLISNLVENRENTEAYVFISSQRSINYSRFLTSCIVRTEKYNGKEIGLIHFVKKNEPTLFSEKLKSCSIVFSLWNIIVNTDVTLIKYFKDVLALGRDICTEYVANNILIELSWKNNKNIFDEIDLRICESKQLSERYKIFENKDIAELIAKAVTKYIDTIFNCKAILKQILRCMQNSFYNIFFSKIDNIYEIFAFQRLKEKLSLNESIKVNSAKIVQPDEIVLDAYSDLTKYKKTYVDVISNLSQSIPSESIRDILVGIMCANQIDAFEVYNNIINVCEVLDLKDTNLYKNTMEARSIL